MLRFFGIFSSIQLVILSCALGVCAQTPDRAVPPLPNGVGDAPTTVTPGHTGPGPFVTDRIVYSIRTSTSGRRFDIRPTDDAQVIARCIGRCTLQLPAGSYELRLYDVAGRPDEETNFEVSGPGSLDVDDASPNVAAIGAVMGSVGPILALAGSVLFL